MFETLMVTEVAKWAKTAERPVDLAFYRTPLRANLRAAYLSTSAWPTTSAPIVGDSRVI